MKETLKSWRKKCDQRIQELCLEGEPKCMSCGAIAEVGHHFFPVSTASGLRYYLPNVVPVCKKCHFQHHSKFDPSIHARIMFRLGKEWYNDLLKKKIELKPVGVNISYYRNKYGELTE